MLKRKWHGIPLALVSAVLVLVLIASGVLAAYNFTGMDVDIAVDEPLQVQYNLMWFVHDNENPEGRWDNSGWHDTAPGEAITASFSAGDETYLFLRMNNRANSGLTVNTVIDGNVGKFTFGTFPTGLAVPASTGHDFHGSTVSDKDAAEWTQGDPYGVVPSGGILIKVKGDTPAPATYSLTFEFTRE